MIRRKSILLGQNGATEAELMEMGNWLTPKLVYRYTKLGNEKLRFTANRLDNVFKATVSTSQSNVSSNINDKKVGGNTNNNVAERA